jgi:hypothetical protein
MSVTMAIIVKNEENTLSRCLDSIDDWGNGRCEFWRERCVRNDGMLRWTGRVHEVLLPLRPCTSVGSPDVVVAHQAGRSRGPEQLSRNLHILEDERALEICPTDPWHQHNVAVFARALQTAPDARNHDMGNAPCPGKVGTHG